MTVEEHSIAIRNAQKMLNGAISKAVDSGLYVKTTLSGDSARIWSIELKLVVGD